METSSEVRLGERFHLRRRLGAGAFGVVYDAWDHARERRVALKQLRRLDAQAVYGFKREFRSLADQAHPNLVGLQELLFIDGQWYLAMDFVDGVDFRTWVRGAAPDFGGETAPCTREDIHEPPRPDGVFDESRLRSALSQLAAGVMSLHRHDKLHRDLKPSNVLVRSDGGVVVLDFGLVASLAGGSELVGLDDQGRGTPGYMAPEQAAGAPISFAADWYAIGAMLFEALTGTLPIGGSTQQMVVRKQLVDAPDPRTVVPGLPDDLAELAIALLRRDPAARAGSAQVSAVVGGEPVQEPPQAPREGSPRTIFLGRDAELARLETALAAHRESPTVLHVHGSSGVGKSALVRRFLDELRGRDAVVLAGRCYERESVPYRALDSLIDALTRYLREQPREDIDRLMPGDVQALARIFPILQRVESVVAAPTRPLPVDPHHLRRRAFKALRELLRRLASSQPVVLWLDDLQWGDADSAALLLDLLAPPNAPSLMLILSYRSEAIESSEMVKALRRPQAMERAGRLEEMELEPLGIDEAQLLARGLAGPGASDAFVEAIAHESGGSPYFLEQLAAHTVGARLPSLVELLAQRINGLPDEPRRLLNVIAIAGRPLAYDIARRAANVDLEDERALGVLRAANLVRLLPGPDAVESYHDRVRESAVSLCRGDEVAATHGRLARTLLVRGHADPEELTMHFVAAGELAEARLYAEQAAALATEKLSFSRAAELYRIALDLGLPTDEARLRERLGDALGHAGRGPEAASVYLSAIEGAPPALALDLRRRAAEHLLRSGHIDEGLRTVREVLDAVGLHMPRTPGRALVSLLFRRAQLKLRGYGFRPRREDEINPKELARIDACWSVGKGLRAVDMVRGADFHARHTILALQAGEPSRVLRAFSFEALNAAMEGGEAATRRVARFIAHIEALAGVTKDPHDLALATCSAAIAAWSQARWREAVELCHRSIELFQQAGRDNAWEVGTMKAWWLLPAYYQLGELAEVIERTPASIKQADELGDLYIATSLRTNVLPVAYIVQDRPEEALRASAEAIARWTSGFTLQHWSAQYAQGSVLLYLGQPARVLDELRRTWPLLRRSMILRFPRSLMQSHQLRARASLATAADSRDRAALLRRAEADTRVVESTGGPWAASLAAMLWAGLAQSRGDSDRALQLVARAEEGFAALDMSLFVAAARRRRGQLLGGDEGRALVATADQWMRSQRVERPDLIVASMAPGFSRG